MKRSDRTGKQRLGKLVERTKPAAAPAKAKAKGAKPAEAFGRRPAAHKKAPETAMSEEERILRALHAERRRRGR